jgi:hypothetical protein
MNDENYYLENNSYYDVDILEKYNAPIRQEIAYFENKKKNSNWMGKIYYQREINKLKKKIQHYVNKN